MERKALSVRLLHRWSRAAGASGVPALHYVAPRSVLVFDHLTRGIALLHAGSEQERRLQAQADEP